ncbi:MAG TPA: inositol monophosphatase family protein [Candidatus Saccharimonadales bacterium]|nr:inositol monophosphatase family protein [Candidatus Saccharimonadales bacterium]
MEYENELKQAFKLADIADEIGMRYFLSRELKVTTKPDSSPVTQGDTEIEKALSKIVTEEFGDSYVGEEGTRSGSSKRRWLVDPIDGTKNFLRGYPVWGSLISLKDGDEVIAASVSAPALGRRWWATKGGGSFTRDVTGKERRISVSKVAKLSDAFLLHGTFNSLEQVSVNPDAVYKLMRSAWRHRSPGDFFGHMLIAEGTADGFVDVPSALWDIEASTLIVREAGGSMWLRPKDESEVKLQRLAVSSNSAIEKDILDFLRLK